jgi:diguanylate cyclase (GGDEF)-like protein/excisionase family DNA binding protein
MTARLKDLPRDVREQTAAALREREHGLIDDAASVLGEEPTLEPSAWRQCASVLLGLLSLAVEDGDLDNRQSTIDELAAFSPPLTARDLIHALHRLERAVLDELALHERLGATSEPWPVVAHSIRAATLEIIIAFTERIGVRTALRDALTTLISRPVFDLVLQQEAQRALRHEHGIAMILFDIDDLSLLNRSHGYGAGDRLLERLGILARRYFRTHDWVARHGPDSIAVLLPETTLDQAAALAARFVEMVRQRLVLVDHKTDAVTAVTVSASAVGTDLVQAEIDPGYVLAEAEAAMLRAKMNGGNRVERVALLPTSVTLLGAANLMGVGARDVVTLVRNGTLRAQRRGRHFHIDRAQIEEYRARRG